MKQTYRVLAYALAVEVVVQTMTIAYAMSGLGNWVQGGGVLNKSVMDSSRSGFTGMGGLMIHAVNGQMLIPLLALVLLVVAFFAQIDGGVRRAAILFGMVVLQVVLGIASPAIPYVVLLHVINAFGILVMAWLAGQAARTGAGSPLGTQTPHSA